MAAVPSFANIIKDAVSIAKEVKKIQILTAKFVSIQRKCSENVKTTLKVPVVTRFGSNVHCLRSVMDNRQNLQELAISKEGILKLAEEMRLRLTGDNFWSRLEKALKVREPIAQRLTKFEKDVPSLSVVPTAFQDIESHLKQEFKKTTLLSSDECAKILKRLEKHRDMAVRLVYLAANILDPSRKGHQLTDNETMIAQSFIYDLAGKFDLHQSKITEELTDYMLNKRIWQEEFVKKQVYLQLLKTGDEQLARARS